MPVKKFKPKTPTLRYRTVSDYSVLTEKEPEKSLLEPLRKSGGRHKRFYRIVDFRRRKFGVKAEVIAIEYDPNRSARIALLRYTDGDKAYILAPNGLRVGMIVEAGPEVEVRDGNALPLRNIPLGSTIH